MHLFNGDIRFSEAKIKIIIIKLVKMGIIFVFQLQFISYWKYYSGGLEM